MLGKDRLSSILWALPVFVFITSQAYPYSSPDPSKTFYGDANGDMAIQLNDITIHRYFVLAGNASYDTPQPNTMSQKWNVCDVNGDRACQLNDVTQLQWAMLGNPINKVFDSWEIALVDLPPSVSVGVHTPFKLSVRGVDGGVPNGRPGIIVKLTIAPDSPVSGKVAGRPCPIPSDQCAVSVSVTDWDSDPSNALTENGPDGFSVIADAVGEMRLVAEFTGQTIFRIPPTSLSIPVYCGTIRFVDADATGANNGKTWADAFTGIQDAINAAIIEDRIWVAEGTYKNAPASTAPVLAMKESVRIYGGFSGTERSFYQRVNPAAHPTILDGEDSSYHVVVGASNAVLDGFTVTGGKANGSGSEKHGAGIYNSNVTALAVRNCTFIGNDASSRAGAMYNKISSVAITNCIFNNNSAKYGGGMCNYKSSPEITGCTFVGNSASIAGGMYNRSRSSPNVVNCIFNVNSASKGGGMFNIFRSSPTITNCTFSSNSATDNGGSVYNYWRSSPIITNCILWNDTPDEIYGTAPTVTYSDVSGGFIGTGNIDVDPQFAGYPDLHLQPTSPCIDAGTKNGASIEDIEGNSRPLISDFDMGAYESPVKAGCWIALNDCPEIIGEDEDINCFIQYNDAECTDTLSEGAQNTCTNSLVTDNGDGTGIYYAIAQGEAVGPGSCVVNVSMANDGISDTDTISVSEMNQSPYWITEPSAVRVDPGASYSDIIGVAADDDVPNAVPVDPGSIVCSAANNTCSFPVSATGSGGGNANCSLNFTALSVEETCTVDIVVTDGLGESISKNINVYVKNLARDWTIMVYLDGDDNSDDNVEVEEIMGLNFLEKVGSTDRINIVALLDRIEYTYDPAQDDRSNGDWKGAKYFYVEYDANTAGEDYWVSANTAASWNIISTEVQDLGEVNMGDPQTFEDFMLWGITEYPASRYIVILSGYGNYWHNRMPDATSSGDAINEEEMKQAFNGALEKTWVDSIDIIAFSTSIQQMIENAYVLREYADYMVGSENSAQGTGLLFAPWLQNLDAAPLMSTADVGKEMVEAWWNLQYDCPFPECRWHWFRSRSVLDLDKMDQLVNVVDVFSGELIDAQPSHTADICDAVKYSAICYSSGIEYMHQLDLFHFASLISADATLPASLTTAAANVVAAKTDAVVWNRGKENYLFGPYCQSNYLYEGLSIYHQGPDSYNTRYDDADFAGVNQWDEFLQGIQCP